MAGLVLLAKFLPETKYRTLEDMEELFMTPQQVQLRKEGSSASIVIASSTDQEKARSETEMVVIRL